MRRRLGHHLTSSVLLAITCAWGFSDVAEAATQPGASAATPSKPLGTLWYPGPYQTPIGAPKSVLSPTANPPAIYPADVKFPEPAPAISRQDKPLGTLWYPGVYNPNSTVTQPLPAPVLDPQPAPPQSQPLPPVLNTKPLGTLWYPGPYNANAPSRPTPVPGPGAVPIPVPALAQPVTPVVPPVVAEPKAAPPLPPSSLKDASETLPTPAGPTETTGQIELDLPVHLSADDISFDQENGLVTATGNVEIIHGQRKLIADRILYNQKSDVVTAAGNIQLSEPGGEKLFGDQMQISGDLKDALIESLGIILTDRSRIAATGARRSDGNVTEMRQGVYSPCNLCKNDPTRPPLWQIKAVKIIHNKNSKTIEYRDAWLEVLGVPVAYTPYLSHPDPTVKRQSGLLVPSFGRSSDLGSVTQVPYFINIDPTRDATITALVTGDGGSGMIGEYRQRFRNGTFDATASLIGGDDDEDFRAHIKSEGRFDFDNTWRGGFDINRATDDTYLRRYGFGSPNSLNSRLFVEGFRGRNYFSANGYAFQGLRSTDDADLEPLVLPLIDFNHLGKPDKYGGQTVLDVNFLAIARHEGTDIRRLSVQPGWQLPFMGPLGDAYKLSLSLNGNLYQVDHLKRDGEANFNGVSGRLHPQVMLDWRLPFVKTDGNISQVLEPVAAATYSPYGGNSTKIPNEDSTELEFDDTNLFAANKFSGLDRVEGGPRLSYGLKWGAYGKGGGSSTFFLGQSWRPRSDDTFPSRSGLEDNFSDIVGRVHITPGPYLNLLYRTRFASDNFTPKRNEATLSAGVPALKANASYVFLESQEDSEFSGREEINFSVNSQLNKFWRAGFSGVRDIAAGEARQYGASLIYENECVVLTTRASRTFFEDRDLRPTDQVTLNVTLKTLGEIRTNIFQK
ncbi:MAG: LPS assembly protein LptD [Proteobacteria bacterium]|nr:LPS assembly protein LptD [Pseudomonadota bacterium]